MSVQELLCHVQILFDLIKLASSREITSKRPNQGEINFLLIMIFHGVFGVTHVNDSKATLVVKTGIAIMEKLLVIVRSPVYAVGCVFNHLTQGYLGCWFHFEVKNPFYHGPSQKKGYKWYKMGFFMTWTAPDQNTVIFFDATEPLSDRLLVALNSGQSTVNQGDPYSMKLVITEAVVACYDKAVWTLRDQIREFEEVGIVLSPSDSSR